ncbi:MAG: helix-turn-helix domain-containing protein [Saprospiraceae bacterium]|nr:helix-turn-helix domain-containing protein [Saprospiraceae bacterium]
MNHFEHIHEHNRAFHIPLSKHPLISVFKYEDILPHFKKTVDAHTCGFYRISLKWDGEGTIHYGRTDYDPADGIWYFFSPNQIVAYSGTSDWKGYGILLHPSFLNDHHLARRIRHYDFFDYAVHEALHLSESEKQAMVDIFEKMHKEYQQTGIEFSPAILISYIELVLNYADRYYKRQFQTREKISHHTLERFEQLVNDFFAKRRYQELGQPRVEYFAQALNLSPSYLSDLMKEFTGRPTLVHLHDRLVEEAKILLLQADCSVSQVAYDLGFEYPQYFSRFFKNKTNLSPSEYRQSGKSVQAS